MQFGPWPRLLILVYCALLSPLVFAQADILLKGIRLKTSPSQSQFTFVLSKQTRGSIHYFDHPSRLVLVFKDTFAGFGLRHIKLNQANITSFTATQNVKELRFTLFSTGKVTWHGQYLAGQKRNELQLVIKSLPNANPGTTINVKLQKQADAVLKQVLGKEFSREFVPFTNIKDDPFVVVIDPGHGGTDTGAIGVQGTQEKQVVLSIAKLLAKEINRIPNMQAKLTRTGDYFVPLRTRLNLARRGNADLFIAIHADAFFNTHATGVSVYALSPRGATTEAARWLAQQHLYSELGDVNLNGLQDRSPLVRSVLIDLAQTATIRDSLRLGNRLLDALDELTSLHYKHVAQAPFVVLKSPDIPSILVETGFMTNHLEEKRLNNLAYQQKLANALFQGIHSYLKTYKR